jgi:hypothetical protein
MSKTVLLFISFYENIFPRPDPEFAKKRTGPKFAKKRTGPKLTGGNYEK